MSDDGHPARRATDVQIPVLSAKVGGLESKVDSQERWIQDLDRKVDDGRKEVLERLDSHAVAMDSKLDKLATLSESRTRQPMLPYITLLVVAGGFLLTIMTLVTQNQSGWLDRIQAKQDLHDDGHPLRVMELMEERVGALLEKIVVVDEVHNRADEEQEHDVGELRAKDAEMEKRNDGQDTRLAILETQMKERTSHFSDKAADRWTRTQHLDYAIGVERRLEGLEDQP